MKKLSIAVIALLLIFVAFFLALDQMESSSELSITPGANPLPVPAPKEMTIDVYWDSTISMQGYTRLETGNVYRMLPDILNDLGGALRETHFFRFGEQVAPVEKSEYLQFRNPECYTEDITSFVSALKNANPEHLSIVITDLFESDADWSNVTQKLRDNYFSKHLTVAVIGIKNPFSGYIYDVGINAAAYAYDSGDNPERFRPFYMFLMGSEGQVRKFIERWESKNIPADEMEYAVFSEHLTKEATAFRIANATKDAKSF